MQQGYELASSDDVQVVQYVKFGNLVGSAHAEMFNAVILQQSVGRLLADPQHFTHLCDADNIRIVRKNHAVSVFLRY